MLLLLFTKPVGAQLWVMSGQSKQERKPTLWELGLQTGAAFTLADIDFKPGWTAGFHLQKSLDYLFSVRTEGRYASFRNEDEDDGAVSTSFQSLEFHLLLSLNNFKWKDHRLRKVNFYAFAGGGVNRFDVRVIRSVGSNGPEAAQSVQTHAGGGMGLAVRLSERMNLGWETRTFVLFGNDADRLDGIARNTQDVAIASALLLNINLGKTTRRTEPLYWANPMDDILEHISEHKSTPIADSSDSDSDSDGVPDARDQDPNTPAGVPVDVLGRPLDSDGDGIADHQDPEPYVPSYFPKEIPTEERIREIVIEEMGKAPTAATRELMINSFLPLIHFDEDSDNIRYADRPHLTMVARMLIGEPNLCLVVTGYTDVTASHSYNFELSYRRAKAVIDHLVHVHHIERRRLILQYNGEAAPIIRNVGSELINRRVEFRIAHPGDLEMERPK